MKTDLLFALSVLYSKLKISTNRICSSTCIGILGRILEVLSCQPLSFFVCFRDVDPLDFKDDRPRSIVAAGDHYAVVISPAFHDRTALQRCVYIAADGVSGFSEEFTIHQVIEIILLRGALEDELVSHIEKR